MTPEMLIARADEIDRRLGPIPGKVADAIAVELRSAAREIERLHEREALFKREISAADAIIEIGDKNFVVPSPVKAEIVALRSRIVTMQSEGALVARRTIDALADSIEEMARQLHSTDGKAASWTKAVATFVRACEVEKTA